MTANEEMIYRDLSTLLADDDDCGGKEKSEGHPSEPREESSSSEANESGW